MTTAILLCACLLVFAAPFASALRKPRTRRFPRWDAPVRAARTAIQNGAGRRVAPDTFQVADAHGRVSIAAVSGAVFDVATDSIQTPKFLNETIARSEGWSILADPDIWPYLQQHRGTVERDVTKGIEEFAIEHRNDVFSFLLVDAIADADLEPGQIRVVPSLAGKARAAAIKQAEYEQREARERRIRTGAEGEPHLIRVQGDGSEQIPLRPGRTEIGRHPDKGDGQVVVTTVSRSHALIEVDELGTATIEDQGSLHGTFVDDASLVPYEVAPLPHGVEVRFGKEATYRLNAGSIGFNPTSR